MRIALATLMLALPLAASGESQFMGSGLPASAASAQVRFVIKVARVLKLQILDHPRTLEVREEDVARGQVVVRGPRLDIVANDSAGYSMRAELQGAALFETVELAGLDATVTATRQGSVVRMPSVAGKPPAAPRPVVYVFKLAPDARPGVYRWPVALSLEQP